MAEESSARTSAFAVLLIANYMYPDPFFLLFFFFYFLFLFHLRHKFVISTYNVQAAKSMNASSLGPSPLYDPTRFSLKECRERVAAALASTKSTGKCGASGSGVQDSSGL
jgi:hypothetical protein